jgi:hypothetical protein
LSSVKKHQVDLGTRRARAIVHIEGLRELNRRANKQKTDALNLCAAMAPTADEAAIELIAQHCDEHERAIGREDVATSPFRANGPVAKLRKIQAKAAGAIGANCSPEPLTLFAAGEEG